MLILAALIALVIGITGIVVAFIVASLEAWLWLLVGWLVFSGITTGMLGWAAVFRTAQARWTPTVNRLGHSVILSMPISLIVMGILLFGVQFFAPWVHHPIEEKEAWLNIPFMSARNIVLFILLTVFYVILVKWSLAADAKVERGEAITEREHYRLTAIAIASVLAYVLTTSVIAIDFVMSLEPHWFSTMFPPYIFITNLYAGIAMMIILGAIIRKIGRAREWLGPSQFQDMGNLMLGFSLFSMGLFFAQYLTIWYGNLPIETHFLIIRYAEGPWPALGWTAFIIAYAIPFILLQSRFIKRRPWLSSPIAGLSIIGFTLERYVLVVPSVQPLDLFISPLAGLVMLAFLGLFILIVKWFCSRCSLVSGADEALPDPAELEAVI